VTRRTALLLLFAAALLALAACSRDKGSTTGSAPAPPGTTGGEVSAPTTTEETTTGGQTTTGATAKSRAYETWFLEDGRLVLDWQKGDVTIGVLAQAMVLLLDGPSGEGESAIPEDTELVNLNLAPNGTATIDLSGAFLSGPADEQDLAKAQVVWTATQFPTVRNVRLLVGGNEIAKNLKRRTYEDIAPPIVVERPTGLDPVGSPLRVSGNANVFEANVTIKLLDESGDEILSTFTTATCGTGCRGTFEKTIQFDASKYDSVTLVVQDDDADGDGKPGYEVRIPLTVKSR
jgi:Immunoglobulin-like domain of bacterial spore germination/Sporulation and spore germination